MNTPGRFCPPEAISPHDDPRHLGIVVKGLRQDLYVGPDLVLRRYLVPDPLGDPHGCGADDIMDDLGIQGLLVADLVVQGRLVHPCPPGYPVHPGPGESLLGKLLPGGDQDAPHGPGHFSTSVFSCDLAHDSTNQLVNSLPSICQGIFDYSLI